MNDIKKHIKQWEKIIEQYDRDAKQVQKKITEILKSEWAPTSTSLITPDEMKQIIQRTGNLNISISKLNMFQKNSPQNLKTNFSVLHLP